MNYAEENFVWCQYDGEWYSHEEGVPSDKYGIVPIDDVVYVITDEDIHLDEIEGELGIDDLGEYVDARWKGDKTYFKVHDKLDNRDFYFDNYLIHSDIVKEIRGS